MTCLIRERTRCGCLRVVFLTTGVAPPGAPVEPGEEPAGLEAVGPQDRQRGGVAGAEAEQVRLAERGVAARRPEVRPGPFLLRAERLQLGEQTVVALVQRNDLCENV